MPFLTAISLQNSANVSDGGLAALAKILPLRSLNLKGCREVTDLGLAALKPLQRLTHLRIQVRARRLPGQSCSTCRAWGVRV